MDNTAPDKRNAFIQVNTWATSKQAAFALLRAIEDELCIVDGGFTAVPMEEPSDAYIEGDEGQQPGALKGALQTFKVWGKRA